MAPQADGARVPAVSVWRCPTARATPGDGSRRASRTFRGSPRYPRTLRDARRARGRHARALRRGGPDGGPDRPALRRRAARTRTYTMQRVDAACERYVGAMANGAFGAVPRARANARAQATARAYAARSPRPRGAKHAGYRLTRGNLGIKFWLVAARDLRAGEEVVLDYGRDGYAAAFRARARAPAAATATARVVAAHGGKSSESYNV